MVGTPSYRRRAGGSGTGSGRALARAVPAILASPAFLRLWRTALAATHHQLMLVLRDRSQLLTITGSALTVDVPVAVGMLIKAVGLPDQLGALLPIPVSVDRKGVV